MTVSVVSESSSAAVRRRQPLLTMPVTSWNHRLDAKEKGTRGGCGPVGETAGECAAVCCCCPCAMVHLVILAVYRLPTGLWRKKKRKMLLRKKRKKLSEEKDQNQRKIRGSFGFYTDDDDDQEEEESGDGDDYRGKSDVVVDQENEMLDRFYWSGFWRSSSQREDDE